MIALSKLQAEICDLAVTGMRPADIIDRIDCHLSTVNKAIRLGRLHGLKIPVFTTGRRPIIHPKEAEAPPAPTLTAEDKARIADFTKRGVGLTSIASHIRKPYRLVIAEIERQKLSRAG